jgi:hypothetical protein
MAASWAIAACLVCSAWPGTFASAAVALPDGRAYELASPGSDKDVISDTGRTRAALEDVNGLPMAAIFASLGFGNVRGSGAATDYVAQRLGEPGTSGWTVDGITPPQEPLSFIGAAQNVDPLYEFFSPDLSRGVFRAWSPLTDAPNVANVTNLYLREDIRAGGAGTYQLLTDAVTMQPPPLLGSRRHWFAGASKDLEHLVFESRSNLTADATGSNVKLYKSDHGQPRLVAANAACPGGSGSGAPCSMAGFGVTPGFGGQYTPRVISKDGSRVNFTSPFASPGTPNTQPGVVSKLFQLDDRGTVTPDDDAVIQVSMPEKAVPEETRAAIYQTASTDGDRVFFRSSEQLTDTPGSGLYMWERQSADETQELAVDATSGSFTLTGHTQPTQGSGTLSNGSATVTGVTGSFAVGQTISGSGIDPGTTVTAVSASGLTLSAPATTDGPVSLTASIEATTDPLPWNATAAQVRAALEGLSMIGAGNVFVRGGPAGSAAYTIEFTGALAGVNVMQLTADADGLSGGGASATVSTTNDVRNLRLIGDAAGSVFGASEDGHRVYFAIAGDVMLWQDADGVPGGGLSFVAALSTDDVRLLSAGPGIFWDFSRQPLSRVAPDGKTLLFEASDGSTLPPGYQHGTCSAGNANASVSGLCSEAYVYRADSSTPSSPNIVCASCNLSVPRSPGDTFLNVRRGGGSALTTSHLDRALTDDGRRVFFDTSEALTPEDTNGAVDVYEYDVPSGAAHLISSGTDPSDSYFMDASANGDDVFFVTRAQLVGWDADQAYDLYDARVGGGFPEPPPSQATCSGDACQGQAPQVPEAAILGSSSFRGLGDFRKRLHRRAALRKCRRGHVKRRVHGKVRCGKHKRAVKRHARTGQRRSDR